jgi:hypothetical protein
MKIDLSIVLSFIALFISIYSIYLQWFRVKGPKISLLNEEGDYRSVLRPYNGLPQAIRDYFPEYIEKYQGYAIVTLVFGNAGDRAGIAKIISAEVQNPPFFNAEENEKVKSSYYNFSMIPAYSIDLKSIVLRNIPIIVKDTELDFLLKVEWGGFNPKTGTFVNKGIREYKMKLLLVPSKFPSE